MPITLKRTDLFPDDVNPLPVAGSAEQQGLLNDELELGNEEYLKSLNKISDIADQIYPEIINNLLNVLREAQTPRPLRVMDLCSGIGVVSLKLIEQDVAVEQLTLVDLSPELLERAKTLLNKSPNIQKVAKLETAQLDVLADDLDRWAPESFDVVVTSNAFQHFPRERQRDLFKQIHRLLAPNGVFLFSSHFKPLRPKWKEFIVDEALQSLKKHGAPPEQLANASAHINGYHNYLNSVDVYNWLEGAGFGFFDCVFRRFIIGIFAAVK